MIWQDIVIGVAQVFFVVALIPSITTKDKPALVTSIMNTTLMGIIATTQFTLGLWFSTITAVVIGLGHLTLAIQKAKTYKSR
jgi:hypothetical protein